MRKFICLFWSAFLFIAAIAVMGIVPSNADASENSDGSPKAYSVRIDGQISAPQLSILKRAIRLANSAGAKLLIVDINTPGGDLATTLEIMKSIGDFNGRTACFVNTDAVSAGSFIASVCDEIWFASNGVMGAAEAVTASGTDIDKSMARKITSFVSAKVRAANGDNSRRALVQRAMNDPDFELKMAGRQIKKKGELLSLTAKEAAEIFDGAPLLSNGTASSSEQVARAVFKNESAQVESFKISWAEIVAKYVSSVSPIFLGIGFFLIFIDIKSGGFGIMAVCGAGIVLLVLAGANLSGIAGYEELAVFLLGALLLVAELLFFPGVLFVAALGALLMVGSVIWALADFIPQRGFEYNLSAFSGAGRQLLLGIAIAFAGLLVFGKFIKKIPFWRRLELKSENEDSRSPSEFLYRENFAEGARALCLTDLIPSGQISFNGKIFDATCVFGHAKKGDSVEIIGKKDFNLSVKNVN